METEAHQIEVGPASAATDRDPWPNPNQRLESNMAKVTEPAGGVQLYRLLCSLADEYRMRAAAEIDHDAASIHLALQALVLRAARAGVHVHMHVMNDSE